MRKRLLCRAVEVPENGLKECEAEDGLKVVVANAGGEFFGFQAICPHQEVPLCEGLFDGSVLTCHMHLGNGMCAPARRSASRRRLCSAIASRSKATRFTSAATTARWARVSFSMGLSNPFWK